MATAHDGSETHVVGIGNLRVKITHEDGAWFAQGLEIDYAAQGSSREDVKRRFEKGLLATIGEHLRIYGTIKKLLQPAAPEMWQELADASEARYSQVSIHFQAPNALPFKGITYIEPKAA
jgi:hypothetical protein